MVVRIRIDDLFLYGFYDPFQSNLLKQVPTPDVFNS